MEEQFAWDTQAPTYNDYQSKYFAEVPEPLLGPVDYGVVSDTAMGEIILVGEGVYWEPMEDPEISYQVVEAGYSPYVYYEDAGKEVETAVPAPTTPWEEPDYQDDTVLEAITGVISDVGGYLVDHEQVYEDLKDAAGGVKDEVKETIGKVVDEVVDTAVDVVTYGPKKLLEPVMDVTLIMMLMMMSRRN